MGVVAIIEEIVGTMIVPDTSPQSAPLFVFGWKGWQNLEVDEIQTDVVILDTPLSSDDATGQGSFTEEGYNISIALFRKSELDYTPTQQEEIVDVMRTQKEKLIYKLRTDQRIRRIETLRTQDVYNAFNVNLTGVLVTFKLTPLPTRPKC
jgi:hypothetical protein